MTAHGFTAGEWQPIENDPLVQMAHYRAHFICQRRAHPYTMLGPYPHPYQSHRRIVAAPVELPSDTVHLMPSPDTCAYMNKLVRNFQSIFGGA